MQKHRLTIRKAPGNPNPLSGIDRSLPPCQTGQFTAALHHFSGTFRCLNSHLHKSDKHGVNLTRRTPKHRWQNTAESKPLCGADCFVRLMALLGKKRA